MFNRNLAKGLIVCALFSVNVLFLTSCASTPRQESTGQYIDDSAITVKVRAALLANKNIKSAAISVKTFKGIVEMSGFVDNPAQKQLALTIARQVSGVRAVVDALVVKAR